MCMTVAFLIYIHASFATHYCKQVWSACKSSTDDPDQVSHEIDILAGHENVVNYVQFRFVSHHFRTLEIVMVLLLYSYAVAVLWLHDLLHLISLSRIANQSSKIPGLSLLVCLSAFYCCAFIHFFFFFERVLSFTSLMLICCYNLH